MSYNYQFDMTITNSNGKDGAIEGCNRFVESLGYKMRDDGIRLIKKDSYVVSATETIFEGDDGYVINAEFDYTLDEGVDPEAVNVANYF